MCFCVECCPMKTLSHLLKVILKRNINIALSVPNAGHHHGNRPAQQIVWLPAGVSQMETG